MRKFLLGCTDFSRMMREDAFYVDKTRYIEMLERDSPYLMFIRPRRFGKSLFLDMLCDYYDINRKDEFEELFGKLYIGSHPTPERGSYLVLSFDFSMVDSSGSAENIIKCFESHCQCQFQTFAENYKDFFGPELEERLTKAETAVERLEALSHLARKHSLPIYVFIDEYDNFANNILSGQGGEARYQELTHGQSFFRTFFTYLKGCAGHTTSSAVKRIFMTGVSPLVLDDVTSGFNIAQNVSTMAKYNGMLGVGEEDIRGAMQEVAGGLALAGQALEGTPEEHLTVLREYYNNYCFCTRGGSRRMYNTNMTLYYLYHLAEDGFAPEQLVDSNSRTDYGKLRHLIVLGNRLNGNFNLLCDLAIDHCIQATLVDRFSLAELKYRNQFVSLLFYMGILTIDGSSMGETVFRVPNRTVEEILVSYIRSSLSEVGLPMVDVSSLQELVRPMALRGQWRGMLEYIHKVIVDCTSIRDFMEGEKCVQIAHLLALQPLACYVSRTEHEASKGYLDLILKPNRLNNSGVLYSYVLEFKYLKEDATDAELAKAVSDAREQLARYTSDPALLADCSGTTLTAVSVVYRKWDLIYCEAEGRQSLI